MLRTNLQALFEVIQETVERPDPWGRGTSWEVYRSGAPTLLALLEVEQKKNPANGRMLNALAKQRLKAQVRGEEFGQEQVNKSLEAEIDKLDFIIDGADAKVIFGQHLRLQALAVKGITGLTDEEGKPIEVTPEIVVELFQQQGWVPAGQPFGGKTLGVALQEFVAKTSEEAEKELAGFTEAAEKNSEGSSAGVPESSEPPSLTT